MRVVADTNTVVSGLLWLGGPRQILDAARSGRIQLFSSPPLLAELEDVLARDKFEGRLRAARVTPRDLVIGYAALAKVIRPAEIQPAILDDPDDDAVLACALAAHAEIIVSGDRHLLNVGTYRGIRILRVTLLLEELAAAG